MYRVANEVFNAPPFFFLKKKKVTSTHFPESPKKNTETKKKHLSSEYQQTLREHLKLIVINHD